MDTASIVVALFVIDSLLFMLIFALGYFFYSRLGQIANDLQAIRAPVASLCELSAKIIDEIRSVDSRVERHVTSLQVYFPCDDDLPLEGTPNFGDLTVSLYQVRDIVEAFKNDLITQVRLSREDYEELMATAESKEGRLIEQLVSLQAQLTDFRNRFDEFTR